MVTKKELELKQINLLIEYLKINYDIESEYLNDNEEKKAIISFACSYLDMIKGYYSLKDNITIDFITMKLETLKDEYLHYQNNDFANNLINIIENIILEIKNTYESSIKK